MISIHIPKNSQGFNLKKELMSAKNIKDRVTKNNAINGLITISHYL